jgi:hypothetical protein
VPLLRHYAKDVPLVIFQRPRNKGGDSDEFMCESITLVVNKDTVVKFRCITSQTEDPDFHALLKKRVPLFVSTSNIDILRAILSRTSSFSTSVGPSGFADVIEGLEIAERARSDTVTRRVYLFENDSERFKKQIEERFDNEQYDVIQVICDRICTQKTIAKDRLQVVCEKFTGMAVIYPSQRSYEDFAPFKQIGHDLNASPSKNRQALPTLILTRTVEEAQFYHQRKLSLLNGAHFTMAVLAYNTLRNKGHPQDQWASKNLVEWKSDVANHRAVRMAMQGRIMKLLYTTPTKILQIVHGTDNIAEIYLMTMDYVKTTMQRIDSTSDTLGRVLNLGDEQNIHIKHVRYVVDIHRWLKQNVKVVQECEEITSAHYDDIIDTFESLSKKFEAICTPQEAA